MADSILFWSAVALEANRVSHSDPARMEQTGPTLSSRALAIIHLAMYDAYAGVAGGPRYLNPPARRHATRWRARLTLRWSRFIKPRKIFSTRS